MQLASRVGVLFSFIIAALGIANCGAPASPSNSNPDPVPPDEQFQITGVVGPGDEMEFCRFFKAPVDGYHIRKATVVADQHSGQTQFGGQSDAGCPLQAILFTTPYTEIPTEDIHGTTIDTSGVFPCGIGGPAPNWSLGNIVTGLQTPDAPDAVDLPEGIAISIEPGTILLMNTHHLNTTTEELSIDTRIDIYTIPAAQVEQEAGVLFFYNPFVRIPANDTASARMQCPITAEITLLNAQSHMHSRGTGYQAKLIDAAGDDVELLYENNSWDQVPVTSWEGGKTLAAGTAIDFRCDFRNDDDHTIVQGPTAADEMCVFIGVYYPRNAALELCSIDDDFDHMASAATYVGTGQASCAESAQCLGQSASPEVDGGDSLSACVVNSCPASAPELTGLLNCTSMGLVDCTPELTACMQASCN